MIPGFGLHKQLALYVEAGIPAPEVLTLATLKPRGSWAAIHRALGIEPCCEQ
jgi:hypothetical protein